MGYGIIYSAEADADYRRIVAKHPIVASRILDEIDKLAVDPVSLALRPSFPHQFFPKYQFWADIESGRCFITILFQYAVNESDILIRGIGITEILD